MHYKPTAMTCKFWKQRLIEKAEQFGATVEFSDYNAYDQSFTIEVLAPDGKAWSEGPQILLAYYFQYDKKSKAEACEDLVDRMTGLIDYIE